MNKKIKISCLPVAGIKNPYQHLMMKGLESDSRLSVKNGVDDRFFGILRTAFNHRPDYIHFDWETSYYYRRSLWMTLISIPSFMLQVYIVKYIFNCKLVWTPHNLIPHDSNHLKIHRFCRRFFVNNLTWIRLFSESSISGAAREFKCNPDKFRIVPEGSYVDYYPNNISRNEARNFLGIKPTQKVILYIGFIKPYKGIIELVESFKKLQDNNLVLVLAGKAIDAYYLESVKRRIGNNIILMDHFIEDNELQFYFNAADVVCLPFKKIENSGSVILSMGFKKAVIAPRMGVIVERLENQLELLYETSLDESLKRIIHLSNLELNETGRKNFQSLSKYRWADFAKPFVCENIPIVQRTSDSLS